MGTLYLPMYNLRWWGFKKKKNIQSVLDVQESSNRHPLEKKKKKVMEPIGLEMEYGNTMEISTIFINECIIMPIQLIKYMPMK